MGSLPIPRPIRIMNISGSPVDRRDALLRGTLSNEPIDVFVGDWMSELNMPSRAFAITTDPSGAAIGYEETFLEALEPALESLASKKQKVAANAGTVATEALYHKVVEMVKDKGLDLVVAWVQGDVVMDEVRQALSGETLELKHICTGQALRDWPYEPLFAQCYLGGMGIAKAFAAGADIVVCGRVADASPIIGAAAWWHSWARDEFDRLARALIAGHLIECSTYVTGGNFTGFKSLDWEGIHDMGYPIAEIGFDGDVVITKTERTGGAVTIETCKEQLLYEIQGMYYLNCDVTAVIDKASFTQLSKDRVRLSGITGLPPPSTTKVGITAFGGYKAEVHWALIGLDIQEKRDMFERQLKHSFGKERLAKFTTFELVTYGSVPEDPKSQNAATVDLRLVAQAKDQDTLSVRNFVRPAFDIIMQSWPAATFHPDMRTATPLAYQEYFPTLIPQPPQTIHFSLPSLPPITISPPTLTTPHPTSQPSYPPTNPIIPLSSFGPTTLAPLGHVVHARAGDKGSNCNVGFFVRDASQWDWLRCLLSTETFVALLADDYVLHPVKIDRMEFPEIWAVHFLMHDWLDRGVNANSTYDVLGKFVAEFVRCRLVEVPVAFLEMGRI